MFVFIVSTKSVSVALSSRGTVVLEAALVRALSAIDRAISKRNRAEASCMGCLPCLFQDCGQLSGTCESEESVLIEPSCEMMRQTQTLSKEAERSWALSQICGFYQRRCSSAELYSDTCIRIMGESCSFRLLQCTLVNTMQNLDPVRNTRKKALCGQRVSDRKTPAQPSSRIMGGSQVLPGSWPWIVNLQLNRALMCGGVLVDTSWVLTAAHCFIGSQSEHYWTAVVGEFDITMADPDEQVIKVNRIIIHPKFNPRTFNNDIALVELSSPVVLSEHVMPVCLPYEPEPPPGAPCLVAGWGSLYEDGPAANVLMEAMVPLLSQSTCKSALGKQLLTSTMFCAGYLSGGIDTCQGDSGGPLIFQDLTSRRFQLYGVTSWGAGCGEKGKPGVYTRVMPYKDWILSEIQKLHLFLKTLLDLLQRADDFVKDKTDLTFFTQTHPQLVEHVEMRTRRQLAKTDFTPQTVNTKEEGVPHLWMSDLLEGGQPVISTFTQLHLPLQFYPNKRTKVCPELAELAQQVNVTKEMYNWILNITPSNFNMNFREVLVDITTKNEHGLYEARVKATVGGRPLTFHSLVGLENDSFYRSMPHIIAQALDMLKS
ncbi:Serine protease 56 [Bagarius yarrelli]|uniref:Serine protease 56 n=1 Tax=Bagarius yarrelli TaxID=175774 RepID=A0A556V7I8_BAGYA|nr:Serine protease 56 [Bagarius yarrelli]